MRLTTITVTALFTLTLLLFEGVTPKEDECINEIKLKGEEGDTKNITLSQGCSEVKVSIINPDLTHSVRIELESFDCGDDQNPMDRMDNSSGPQIWLTTHKGTWTCSSRTGSATGVRSTMIKTNGTWGPETKAKLIAKVYQDTFAWAYIAIRGFVAIMFVMIPGFLLFLFFHRRRTYQRRTRAMEEEERRNHRRYSIAVIGDMRHDVPPTYDDVYETKEPPPSFSEAVVVVVPPISKPGSPESRGLEKSDVF